MDSRTFYTPKFKVESLSVLQLVLENYRRTCIVKEFIITTREEINAALHDEFNTPAKIQQDLLLYGMEVSKTTISFSMMNIMMTTCTIPKNEPMLIGFGGLSAINGTN